MKKKIIPHEVAEQANKNFRNAALNFTLIVTGCGILLSITVISLSHIPAVKNLLSFLPVDWDVILQKLIFGCIGLFAIALGIERSSDTANLKKNMAEQTTSMQSLSQNVQNLHEDHRKTMQNIGHLSCLIELKNHVEFPTVINEAINSNVPKQLAFLFREKFDYYSSFLTDAIKTKRVNFTDRDLFSLVYRKWLDTNPKGIIYATSSPDRNYFWSTEGEPNTKIEDAIANFIKNGGEMHRIFITTTEDLKGSRCNK